MRHVCPLTEADTWESLEAVDGDELNVKSTKALKKGTKLITDDLVFARMAASLIFGRHVEKFNAMVLQGSVDKATETARHQRNSPLRTMLANDRQFLKDVMASIDAELDDENNFQNVAIVTSIPHRDGVPKIIRSHGVRTSGQFSSRVKDVFDGFPYEWVARQHGGQDEQDKVWDDFKAEQPCDLEPWFARRIHTRMTNGEDLRVPAFDEMLDFWADDGDTIATV